MQYVPAIRRLIRSAIVPTAMLYGSIFVANHYALKACSTAYLPPSIHCKWDLSELKSLLVTPTEVASTGQPQPH